eukprot:m.246806 g.246806  ORF g.246806 m.246806 type:complete len:177 (-) comp26650_c0_seq16:4587-5117(-)
MSSKSSWTKRVRIQEEDDEDDDFSLPTAKQTAPAAPPKPDEEDDEDEDDDDDFQDELEADRRDNTKQMKLLLDSFTPEQRERHEVYRRSKFRTGSMKKFLQSCSSANPSKLVIIVMSGLAKVYAGELVEEARDVMEELGDRGPIQPKHLREASRRLAKKGAAMKPLANPNNRLFHR